MRKIISGMLGIVMTAAVVGGVAYAAFSSQATVSGISIAAGDAELLVFNTTSSTYVPSWNTGLSLANVYPGYTNSTTLKVKNSSTALIPLVVTAKLTAAISGWGNNLTYATLVNVQDSSNPGDQTGYKSLAQWNAGEVSLPGGLLAQGADRTYNVLLSVGPSYVDGPNVGNPVSNEISGEAINGITFTLTGTQP